MNRTVQDRYLPPDHDAFVAAEPPTGRVIVIAPTRAACETIEIALSLHIETYLETTHSEQVRGLARGGRGFGIIAGTGTGKTLAIRPIAEEILRAPLKIGVVNREREATPELPNLNVLVVTTGIARRWFQDGDILERDTLVVDEIHQTSAELELCLALGKRVGCRFVWLSATVDPSFYKRYLGSSDVLQVFSFDKNKAADVRVVNRQPNDFLDADFVRQMSREKRGVGVFLPTRAGVEQAANQINERFPRVNAAFYHGGEPIRVIRPFLEDSGAPKPFLLAMTAAGQSALNVRGLDTVVIDDTRFSNQIQGGRNVLTRLHLGNNELLQMAGRVHGRVAGGRVFILSDRDIDFAHLRPTAPEFQLAGDSERVALTCADLGVRADELDLPVPLNKIAYREALENLQKRGIIGENGRLSTYGKTVEALPVERAWGELIVNAPNDLMPFLAVMSSIESLHRMTREERDIDDLIVAGSDHLTAYNLYAEAFERAGSIGEVYGMARHAFDAVAMEMWAQERGVLVKAIEDAALAMACVFRGVRIPLPTQMPFADELIRQKWCELLARWMPFDLVIDEQTSDGQSARVSKTSVCGTWGPIAGELRFFADRMGVPRAAIEGTQIHPTLLRRFARKLDAQWEYNPRRPNSPLQLKRRLEYFGFDLESEAQPMHEFDGEMAIPARRALSVALASMEARHPSVHRNRAAIEEVRELFRRSGGKTPRLGQSDLADIYESQMTAQNVCSIQEFREAQFKIRVEDFVSNQQRELLMNLPLQVLVRDREVELEYEVDTEKTENQSDDVQASKRYFGVARLRLTEKMARTLDESELPQFDRPFRFMVSRGSRGSVRADSLEELQNLLEGPWIGSEKSAETEQRSAHGAAKSSHKPHSNKRQAMNKFTRAGGPKRGKRR